MYSVLWFNFFPWACCHISGGKAMYWDVQYRTLTSIKTLNTMNGSCVNTQCQAKLTNILYNGDPWKADSNKWSFPSLSLIHHLTIFQDFVTNWFTQKYKISKFISLAESLLSIYAMKLQQLCLAKHPEAKAPGRRDEASELGSRPCV